MFVGCVLEQRVAPQVSRYCQNCELCSCKGMVCTVLLGLSSAVVSDLRNTRNRAVSVCHVKKTSFPNFVPLLCFYFSWIYSRVNVKVKCRKNVLQGYLFPLQH